MKNKIVAYFKRIIGLIKKGGEKMLEFIKGLLAFLPPITRETKILVIRDVTIGITVAMVSGVAIGGSLLAYDLGREAFHQ